MSISQKHLRSSSEFRISTLISQDTCCCCSCWPLFSPAQGVLRSKTHSIHLQGPGPKLPSKSSWIWLTSNLIQLTIHDGSCFPQLHAGQTSLERCFKISFTSKNSQSFDRIWASELLQSFSIPQKHPLWLFQVSQYFPWLLEARGFCS